MKTEIKRKLDKPYFLLRTHDGIDHFLQPQIERMFYSEKNGLSRFMPRATIVDEKGVKTVSYQLTKVQAKTLRPLRSITHPELKALKTAAAKFYNPDRQLTKFESSLRKAFRLPDPELEPDAYFLWGSRKNPKLLVLWGVEKVPGTSLPITLTNQQEASQKNESVVQKLRVKVIRRTKEWVMTASAICLIVAGAMAFLLSKDTSPPEVSEVSSINDPNVISITFDEKIDPSSIGLETFKIRNTAHVLSPQVDQKNPKRVILSLSSKLIDGEDYFLDFGLKGKPRDLAGNVLGEEQVKDSESIREFRFEDLLPPQVIEVEPLPPHSLIVRLNEAVGRRSAIRPSTFRLSDFRLSNAELSEDLMQVVLEFEETLVHNGSYLLEINGLEDDSEYRNQLHEKIEFRYLDTFAPDLIASGEGESQSEVILRFDECLDPVTALDKANYEISDGIPVKLVIPYKEFDDPKWGSGSFSAVRLITEPLVRRREYKISAHSIADRMNPPNVMGKQHMTYSYNGALDRSPPFIRKVRGSENLLFVEFSEILDEDKITLSELSVRDLKRNKEIPIGALAKEVRGGTTVIKASLATAQFPGRLYKISIRSCSDASGNATHLDNTYEARGIFRKPISLVALDSGRAGGSMVNFTLPPGVRWEAKEVGKIEAYGISTSGGKPVEVEKIEYESKDGGGLVKLNLRNPLEVGSYQFYLEGAILSDGSLVDRPYRGIVEIGS
jgi:hypothetical protein